MTVGSIALWPITGKSDLHNQMGWECLVEDKAEGRLSMLPRQVFAPENHRYLGAWLDG